MSLRHSRGGDGGYSSNVFLEPSSTVIFNNHTSPVGSTVNLGSFPIGTELVFRLYVEIPEWIFCTGPAGHNFDNMIHARVQENWMPDETLIGFEDLEGGGDLDYDDVVFSLTYIDTPPAVPAPAGLLLGIVGASTAGWLKRRRTL